MTNLMPDAVVFAGLSVPRLMVGLFVLYRVGIIIYRLFFHPLAKFPGPKLYAATGIPYYYQDKFEGRFVFKAKDLHAKYGPWVRVTPDRLIVDAAISNKEILGRPASAPEFGKTLAFYGVQKPVGIAAALKDEHRRQRRLMSPAFSESSLREQEHVIRAYIDLFLQRMQEHAVANKTVDVTSWFNFLTFDITGDMAFGESFGSLESGEWNPRIALLFQSIKFNGIVAIMAHYPILGYLVFAFSSFARTIARKSSEDWALACQQTDKRVALGADARLDFMTYILRGNKDGKGMSMEHLYQNTRLLLIGGSETTATALCGLMFYLTRAENNEVCRTVIEEVRAAGFTSAADIDMVSTAPLRYLHSCIEETLRMMPPSAYTPPRVSPGDFVAGVYIPKGVEVDTHNYAAGRSPANFAEPDSFLPQRWLPATHPQGDTTGRFAGDNKGAIKPFSAGPRDCVGKNLAYAELRVVITLLLWHFDLEAPPGQDDWQEKQTNFNSVWAKGPLMIRFKPRVFA